MSGSRGNSERKSIRILTIINVVGALLGVVYSIVQARLFGVSREVELYFAATTLVYTVMSLTQTGQITEIFLPFYHKIKNDKGRQTAFEAFSILLNWMLVVMLCLSLIFWVITPFLINVIIPSYSQAERNLGVDIFRIFIPFLVIDVAKSLFETFFNAEKSYGRPEVMATINTLISIVTLVFLYKSLGIWSLVLSLWIGKIFQFIAYLVMLKRFKFQYSLKFRSIDFSIRPIFRKALNTFVYVSTTQVYILILNSLVTLLPQGLYAVFKYIQQLFTKTNGLLLRPISTVSFTSFSLLIASKAKASDVRTQIQSSLTQSFFAAVFIFMVVLVSGKPILSFLWGSDKFGPDYISIAYILLCVYFFLLIFSGISQIYRKLTMAFGFISEQYLLASFVQVLTGLIAFFSIKKLGMNGLYLTIAFNTITLAIVPIAIVYFRKREYFTFHKFNRIVKITACLILAYLAAFLLGYYTNLNQMVGRDRYTDFAISSAYVVTAIGSSVVFAVVFGVDEVRFLTDKLRRKISGVKSTK